MEMYAGERDRWAGGQVDGGTYKLIGRWQERETDGQGRRGRERNDVCENVQARLVEMG